MKRTTITIIVLICLAVLLASAADLRCGAVWPGESTFVLICRAGRLGALAGIRP